MFLIFDRCVLSPSNPSVATHGCDPRRGLHWLAQKLVASDTKITSHSTFAIQDRFLSLTRLFAIPYQQCCSSTSSLTGGFRLRFCCICCTLPRWSVCNTSVLRNCRLQAPSWVASSKKFVSFDRLLQSLVIWFDRNTYLRIPINKPNSA